MQKPSDHDHIITEIRRTLHDPRGSRAAVMVGSGLSKNCIALTPTNRSFPTWNDLVNNLTEALYPKEEVEDIRRRGHETSAALRLAEEYQVAFFRPALLEMVRKSIPDDHFDPSALHRQLLELPWADVFTTNYDTQLEKASKWVWRRQYSVVRGIPDLPVARSPRIVKLHGTLPDLAHLVLTEEDFRRYPSDFAPFVNLVGTSLSENIFCLVGFSGNDPNFLAWTGWVRDQLKEAAPKIYLLTAPAAPMKSFQRQLLEARNVLTIDLKQRYDTEDVAEAHRRLLNELREPVTVPVPRWNTGSRYVDGRSNPHVVNEPYGYDSSASTDWNSMLKLWERSRTTFKGWIVLPYWSSETLTENTLSWIGKLTNKEMIGWPLKMKIGVARELAWRCETASFPLPDNFVYKIVDKLIEEASTLSFNQEDTNTAEPRESDLDTETQQAIRYLQLQCLRHSREVGDDARFARFMAACDIGTAQHGISHEERQFLTYQMILRMFGRLEQHIARDSLDRWDTRDASPIWAVRKASLCFECGRSDSGAALLDEALVQLRKSPAAVDDMRTLSTEGSLLYLRQIISRSLHEEKSETDNSGRNLPFDVSSREIIERLNALSGRGCDPHELLQRLGEIAEYRPRKQLGQFEEEHYDIGRVHRTISMGDNQPLRRAYTAIRVIEDAGIPLKIAKRISTTVGEKTFHNSAMAIAEAAPHEAFGLVLRSRNEKLISEFLSRRTMAGATSAQVSFLQSASIEALRTALAHLHEPPKRRTDEDSWWERQLEIASIVLDRVSACLSQSQLSDVLKEFFPLLWDNRLLGRVSGYDDFARAMQRCCRLLTADSLTELVPMFANAPVLGSVAFPESKLPVGGWTDALQITGSQKAKCSGKLRQSIRRRVKELISAVQTGGKTERTNAIDRLVVLKGMGGMSTAQSLRFSEALLSRLDQYGMPNESNKYSAWLMLRQVKCDGPTLRAAVERLLNNSSAEEDDFWGQLLQFDSRIERRTGTFTEFSWTAEDIDLILAASDKWVAALSGRRSRADRGKRNSFGGIFADKSLSDLINGYRSWIRAVEDIVLLSTSPTDHQLDKMCGQFSVAKDMAFPTVGPMPALAQLGRCNADEVVEAIRDSMASKSSELKFHGCSAIVRWAQLSKRGCTTPIATSTLRDLGLITRSSRDRSLPLLLDTSKNVVAILGRTVSTTLVQELKQVLERLGDETEYSRIDSDITVNQRAQLRQHCVKLVVQLRRHGFGDKTTDRWIAVAQKDCFEDVRRLVSREPESVS